MRALPTAWVVRGEVPGPDVDEFANPEQVRVALAGAGPDTLLAAQHPHRTPAAIAAGLGLAESLPHAREVLARLRAAHYRRVTDVVAPYIVDGTDGTAAGLLALVDPEAVGGDGVAQVRHSEEVYPEVVAERSAVLAGLGYSTSAALLVPVRGGEELTAAVEQVARGLGDPAVRSVDSAGRRHLLWLLGPGPQRDGLLARAGAQPLLVADGNHRVAASAAAGLGGMLAMVTGGPALQIGAIHRVLSGTGRGGSELVAAWRSVGLAVAETTPHEPSHPGTVVAVTDQGTYTITLPPPGAGEPVPRIDHAVVERLLLAEALGVDPAGPSVRALPAPQLGGLALPAGVDALLLLAPVPYEDVLSVHAQSRTMPRKSTYFTPKPRSGLLLADLAG
ncbi:hypothetical protein GCM10012275_58000 [Longimycelium tulufanense]|uniref:DUF1015 domain-containing protein n=1 Tax=Longimycelium tulufanense TaxID=907463 RepID=A0A8J3CK08_9PSEU|nr:hypothetical protein GCM10012275_58000 [Longimycelium tulufanense]